MERRNFIKAVSGGFLASMLSDLLVPTAAGADASNSVVGKAKRVVVLWMNGGPSHVDTFDPKPGTAVGGPFKAIKTRAKGISICEHLPQVAEQAHHLAILRGMTTKEGNHERARYLLHTGYTPNPTVLHPSLGAWIGEEIGARDADLPAFVSLAGPSHGAGFLGAQYDPLVVPKGGQTPQNIALPKQVDGARFDRRKAALEKLEAHFFAETGDPKVAGRRGVYAQAIRMMRSTHLKAFDLSDETEATKKAYGDTDFGRGCLAARRLLEAGVKVVEVTLDGWDTHQDNFGRTTELMSALDPAMATLIKDLDQRKMLDSTVVLWLGDFGRTPKINTNDGRDHFPGAFSAVIAGGGIRGGVAYGKTDERGEKVVEKPVKIANLFATATRVLGIDGMKTLTTPQGRPIAITDSGSALSELLL